jgi:hypothetical protein
MSEERTMQMKFRHVSWDEFKTRIGGAALVGYVTATYDELLRCFGLPDELFGDIEKVACEWFLIFADGTGATIYSYGEITSKGHDIPEGPYRWHIGGACTAGVDRVAEVLGTRRYEYLPEPPPRADGSFDSIPF